jgi:hypothetical protein
MKLRQNDITQPAASCSLSLECALGAPGTSARSKRNQESVYIMTSFTKLSHRWIAISLIVAVTQLTVICGTPLHSRSSAPASLIVNNGVVRVDGERATSGQTVFSESTIAAAAASASTLMFTTRARIEVLDETELKLNLSEAKVLGVLNSGRVRVFAPAGRSTEILTDDASIIAESSQPATFTVYARCGETVVATEAGRVWVRIGKSVRTVMAGESFSTQATATTPSQSQNLSSGKKLGLFALFGSTAAILLIALWGRDHNVSSAPVPGGCIDLLSGPSNCR